MYAMDHTQHFEHRSDSRHARWTPRLFTRTRTDEDEPSRERGLERERPEPSPSPWRYREFSD